MVDDEKKVLIVARKILRSAGYDVEVCLGPEEAAEIVANRGPVAVLFTDDRMPGMRGTELLEQVKRLSPSTVRVLTTAYYDQQLIEAIVNKGEAFRFVKKPIDFNKVLKVIRECVEQYEINKKSEDFQNSIKNLTQTNQILIQESEGLTQSIRSLKKKIALVTVVALLIFAAAVGFSLFSELQRQERLKETSITQFPAEIAHIFGRELGDDEKSMLEGRVQGMMHKGNCTRQELIDQIKSLLRNKSSK